MEETKDLVRRARAGDADAFEELVAKRKEMAAHIAYQIVGDWEEARDVAQAAFVKLWQQLDRYDDRYPFDVWFRRIVANQAIDSYRRRRSRRDTAERVRRDPTAHREPGAVGQLDRQEVQRLFDEAASQLPAQQRAVFVLRQMEELSPREIAQTLGITESTVRNHLFKARVTLQSFFRERYPEYLPRSERGEGEK